MLGSLNCSKLDENRVSIWMESGAEEKTHEIKCFIRIKYTIAKKIRSEHPHFALLIFFINKLHLLQEMS